MPKTKRASAKKTSRRIKKINRGIAAMTSLKYAVTTIVVVCALILVVLTALGPRIGLQLPPIEPKAMEHIEKMKFLNQGEKIEAYKATSYYSYNSAVVVTDKRVFAFYRNKIITSIPLNKISLVLVKDTELGHQEVMISAQVDGVIGLDLYHSDVQKFLKVLKVNPNMVKHYNKHDVKEGMMAPAPAAQKAAAH